MILKGRSLILCVSLACYMAGCGADGGGTLPINSSLSADDDGDKDEEKKESDAKKAKETAAKDAEKKAEKAASAAKAVTRKEIQNAQDKITRAQADKGRMQQLLDSQRTRRDGTKSALADLMKNSSTTVSSTGSSTTTSNIKKSKETLQAELKVQEAEVIETQNNLQALQNEIDSLEKLIDELTKRL